MSGELNIEIEGKREFKLPKGGTIVKKSSTISVREIENGFVLRKNYDIKWMDDSGETHYEYFTKEFYSEENPVTIAEPAEEKSLADKLGD